MKVLQGIVSVPASKFDALGEYKKKIYRLWLHESTCVYSDRLVNAEDKQIFKDSMKKTLKEEVSIDIDTLLNEGESLEQILFGNFMDFRDPSKFYVEIDDKEKLESLIQQYIDDHNQENKFKIDIVLFEDAVRLLTKINRIISTTFGHALLIGLGGSGRHTLTRLAAFMQDYEYYEVSIKRFPNIILFINIIEKYITFNGN
jgi:dynein heavy chain, axonemal